MANADAPTIRRLWGCHLSWLSVCQRTDAKGQAGYLRLVAPGVRKAAHFEEPR